MAKRIFFVVGTDTGVGKTVFAAALTGYLCRTGILAAAVKPLCSGGRDDARLLRLAAGNVLSLDEINPWHFRAPISPLLAARKERRRVELQQVVKHIRNLRERFEMLVVEGAGGLLSPLGEKFDSRDCLMELKASPIIVCPNRLGAINQVLLVLEALPKRIRKKAQIVLISPQKPDRATSQNLAALQESVDPGQLHLFPWLNNFPVQKNRVVDRALERFMSGILSSKPQ